MFVKAHPVSDKEARQAWNDLHDYCQVCGIGWPSIRWLRFPNHLETHHIVKQGRSDEPCNFLRVCTRCHRIIEGEKVRDEIGLCPAISFANVLWTKKNSDPTEYDLDRLTALKHMNLPRAKKLPQRYIDEWTYHRHGPYGSA